MPKLALCVAAAALVVPASASAAIHKDVPLAQPVSGPATGKLAAPAAAPPPGTRPPAGYTIVESPMLGSPAGTQVRGVAFCPGRKVAIEGTVFVASTDVRANVNSSFPLEQA